MAHVLARARAWSSSTAPAVLATLTCDVHPPQCDLRMRRPTFVMAAVLSLSLTSIVSVYGVFCNLAKKGSLLGSGMSRGLE